jgi:NTE family protein
MQKITVGLALGSGGAKGISHIGVIKAFEKHKIPIDFIAGSSIGALIGAYYASHTDGTKLEEAILGLNKIQGFSLLDPTFQGGFFKGEKIEALISDLLKKDSFEKLSIPFAAVATDFITAESVIIKRGNLAQAVRASISLPSFLSPVSYEGKLLADGGLSNPVPVEIVRKMGADIVVAVNLDSNFIENPEDKGKIISFSRIPVHSINILRYHLALHSAKTADFVLEPKVYIGGIIGWKDFFDTNRVKEMIKKGEEEAEKIIPSLKKLILNEQKKVLPGFIEQFSSLFKRIKLN